MKHKENFIKRIGTCFLPSNRFITKNGCIRDENGKRMQCNKERCKSLMNEYYCFKTRKEWICTNINHKNARIDKRKKKQQKRQG